MKSIAAHCRYCTYAVTCTGPDDATELTGICPGCGQTATVIPYTPRPFSGQPVDANAPLMAAHVGPFGAVPVANFSPQASGDGTISAPTGHTEGIGGYNATGREAPLQGYTDAAGTQPATNEQGISTEKPLLSVASNQPTPPGGPNTAQPDTKAMSDSQQSWDGNDRRDANAPAYTGIEQRGNEPQAYSPVKESAFTEGT